MKNIKLILLILFAFILIPVVHADECDEETMNQMREELANSDYSLKIEYKDGKKPGMYAKIVNLPEGYEAFLLSSAGVDASSLEEYTYIGEGLKTISFLNKRCPVELYYSTVKIPYYNQKNKNVFADGSIVEESSNKINIKRILLIGGLSITVIGLLIVAYIMIKGRMKHEE